MEQRSTVIKYIGLIVALFFGWQLSYSQCSVNITGNLEMCVGGTTELDAGAGYNTYAWSSGASNGQTIIVNTLAVSIGYRHWINPYVNIKDRNCNSCAKRWSKGRMRKWWRKVWR